MTVRTEIHNSQPMQSQKSRLVNAITYDVDMHAKLRTIFEVVRVTETRKIHGSIPVRQPVTG
jgi:hypothetical protein